MRFIDEARITVSAGHGGPGCISFRRETFAPRGGPNGGDGGDGGDVYFVATNQKSTLQDVRFKRIYEAENGHHGSGSNKAGADGEDIEITLPVGTIIKDQETGEVLVDLTEEGQRWLACKGGRGGKGNAHFVTSTFQAPRFAQPGEPGTQRKVILELKLLADAAIIGFPNAGKSTLISKMSAARPKVADYAFTTLVPNLGVVSLPDLRSFVIADIPGLIEGAHKGEGLGHRFLKHIERTQVFVHLLDGSKLVEDATCPGTPDGFEYAIDDLIQRYSIIRSELGHFNEALLFKPEIVAINKLDILRADPELLERAQKALRSRIANIRGSHPSKDEPFLISGVTGEGVQTLVSAIDREMQSLKNRKEVLLPDDEQLRNSVQKR